jgi:hypothetical protein
MLHYTVHSEPASSLTLPTVWSLWGKPGGWLGVERWQLCLQDHWVSLCMKCGRMVDSVSIRHTISIL